MKKSYMYMMIFQNLDPQLQPFLGRRFSTGKNIFGLFADELSLLVDDEDNKISIELAIHTSCRFGIQKDAAEKMAEEILEIVRDNWEKLAKKYGLSRGQIEYMRPAFSECYFQM